MTLAEKQHNDFVNENRVADGDLSDNDDGASESNTLISSINQ